MVLATSSRVPDAFHGDDLHDTLEPGLQSNSDAVSQPGSGSDGHQKNLFFAWFSASKFRSVVSRECYQERLEVLRDLSTGQTPSEVGHARALNMNFIYKTRNGYSVTDGTNDLYYHARKGKPALLVVPADLIYDVTVMEHDAVQHQGVKKTWYEISQRYHGIPKRAVGWVVAHCAVCESQRSAPRPAVLQPIVSSSVMERVQMDLIDMRAEPDGKYRWILHIKDHYSRFCMLYPLKRRRGRSVVRHFLNWIAFMGPPTILQTDHGREFANHVLADVCQQHQMEIRHGQTGRPRSQGLIERANRHVRAMVAKWCRRHQRRDWARCLPTIATAYNLSVHTKLKQTPYERVFSRRPQICRHLPSMSCPPVGRPSASSSPAESKERRLSDHEPAECSDVGRVSPRSQRSRTHVPWPRGTRVSLSVYGIDRLPLSDYRVPAIVLEYTVDKGYRLATAHGVLSDHVPARHVGLLPSGLAVPVAAEQYASDPAQAPVLTYAACVARLQDPCS